MNICKIIMYEFWYDYVKSKYEEKSKIMLYEYRPVYSPDKKRIHYCRYCKRYWKQDLILQITN